MARKANDSGAADPRSPATRVKAGTLAAALKAVRDVVEGRSTIPILQNVLVEAGDGRITVMATDLDIIASCSFASDDRDGPATKEWIESIRPFATTLPGAALGDVVGGFDGEAMVTLTGPQGDEARATIAAGRSRFRLACLPADDFPASMPFEVEHSFEIGAAALGDALASVDYAVSTEETRYYLNGVYLHTAQAEGEPQVLRLAATDGNRLARRTLDVPEGAAAIGDERGGIIIGRKTVRLLDRLLPVAVKACGEDKPCEVLIDIARDGRALRFALPGADESEIEILSKAIDGSFPDYNRVIPVGNERRAVLPREQLMAALRRVSLLAPKESRAVKAEFSGSGLKLSVCNAELGLGEEELACDWAGKDFAVGFNGTFWREALARFACDEIIMLFGDAGGPAVLLGPDDEAPPAARFVQVIMPMRV